MSLKTEFEEISKNKWGKGILISWGIFIIFTFWNLIAAFIFTATRNPGYAGQGVISLLALGAATGIGTPELHKIFGKNQNLTIFPFTGKRTGMSIQFKF